MHALAYSVHCGSDDSVRVSAVLFFPVGFSDVTGSPMVPADAAWWTEGSSPSPGRLSVRQSDLCWTKRPLRWSSPAGTIYSSGIPKWRGRSQLLRRESDSPDSSYWGFLGSISLASGVELELSEEHPSSEKEHIHPAVFSFWARIIFCWTGEIQVFLPLFLPS